MQIHHVGLVCRQEAEADRFFNGFLGLKKSERKTIPVALAGPLFGLDRDIDAVTYAGGNVRFEIFFSDDPRETAGRIGHACLAVPDPAALAVRAEAAGVGVLRAPRGDGWVIFLAGPDGHKFEIKKTGT